MKKLIVLMIFSLLIIVGCDSESGYAVTDVESFETQSIYADTAFDALDLPETVTVTLANGDTLTASIEWDLSSYNAKRSGEIEGLVSHDLIQSFTIGYTYEIMFKPILSITEEKYSILHEALLISEVDSILDLEGPYTVFAPTNDAFETLFETLETTKEAFLARDDLADLLLYHIMSGKYTNNVLIASVPGELSTLDGNTISIRLEGARLQLNNYVLLSNTLEADNGWLYEIDTVLLSTESAENIIGDFFDEDFLAVFSELFTELDIPLELLLEGSLTVFIPSETALNQFLESNDITVDAFMNDEAVIDLLSYHVFAGQFLADQLYNDAPINIRNIRGDLVRVDVVDNQLMIGSALVESTETLGNLALVHIIDHVLIPPELIDRWGPTPE